MNKTSTHAFNFGMPSGTSVTNIDAWGITERVAVNEFIDKIEMVYIQTSTIHFAVYPPRPAEKRVFKIIFSCVDGKWSKSEPIFGKIIPSQDENYEFED